jgi:fucose permease
MKYPQLIYGMLGIFVYVGVEVTIDNNFGALLNNLVISMQPDLMKARSPNIFHCIGVA